jgi:hypothetical protein
MSFSLGNLFWYPLPPTWTLLPHFHTNLYIALL